MLANYLITVKKMSNFKLKIATQNNNLLIFYRFFTIY